MSAAASALAGGPKQQASTDLGEIVSRARDGDADAWGEIYKRHAPAIYRFCRRALPTREDAEDATGEIFLKLRDRLAQYDPTRPFSAWLYKVAANHCWDSLRRRRIRQALETGGIEEMPLEHPDPGELNRLVDQQSGEQIRRALDKLPARARMALVLRYYADMSYDEIADALGVRRAFVGVVLLRARHQLREIMLGQGRV
jgi:RNA polymerase sigma-70 factor (ECF subfamily)